MMILAGALPRELFDVRFVVLSEPGRLAGEAEALGVPVHVLGLRREMCREYTHRCLGDAVQAVRKYRQLARHVDIVDAWLVPAYTFAGIVQPFARVPVLMAGRRSTVDVDRTRTWYREAAGRLAMREVDAVVANSQAAASDAIAIERIDPRRVHVIRNAVVPIETSDADRLRIRRAWGYSPDAIVVGCVGNFKPGKGHQLILEAASELRARHPSLRYCLVGDGPLRGWLEREIHRRNLDGMVALRFGESDARSVYGAFDIAVQASDSEGLPNTVLEAAAAGLPIVATAVGGTGEIVTSGVDGILVAKGDRQGFLEAVGRLAQDHELRGRLGSMARSRAQEFSAARLAEQTGALYLRLARGS